METSISIYSDVVCPWCYIGKKRLEKAIESWEVDHPGDKIVVEWKPFQLNPDLPEKGEDREAHMVKKFGSLDRVKMMTQRVSDIAKEDGLQFSNILQGHQPNTLLLHALIRKARTYGKESELAEVFFQKFFSEEKNLSDDLIIRESLTQVGVPASELDEVRKDPSLFSRIETEENEGKMLGVTGVPFYIFNEKYAVSGAQPVDLFLQVFERLQSESGT
ncbi:MULTISPECIES: DsbA family oxidoreductase [unclassified Leptospira]|uniref:DsbA family oxidoreductase n=1 Tax=unclassified Leptospira TaxID=2633828 RepID=UPI0002BED8FC|nr:MULTISPECIES: DsbA family oxidoreductase [unclassified Leptospira]EMJ99038.1 DSBA-like thioredoxin domain protein [Leptospira sp. B5-022]MCR1793787.1 DsbA family oxidoreductase [Leptospira sp. id769339]